MTEHPDRRGADRRRLLDLTRPRYLDRRRPRSPRRGTDLERLAQEAEAANIDLPHQDGAAVTPVPATHRALPDLEADYAELQAAMDRRLAVLRQLPEEEFQARQARDADLLSAWAAGVSQLQQLIAAERARLAAEQPGPPEPR